MVPSSVPDAPARPHVLPSNDRDHAGSGSGSDLDAALGGLTRALEATRAAPADDARAQAATIANARAAIDRLEEAWSRRAANAAPLPDGATPQRWVRERTKAAIEDDRGLSLVHVIAMVALVGLVGLAGAHGLRRRRRSRALLAAMSSAPVESSREGAPLATWSGQLRVAHVFDETANIRTFRLVPIEAPTIPFAFRAGQYVRVSAEIDGTSVTRAYSISSGPGQRSHIDLTIKRERDGKMSGYFHDRAKVGTTIAVAGPGGRFTFDESRERLLLVGGGVGLTPLMSIVRDLLARGWPGEILLISSIARADERLFGVELDLLASRHRNLKVVTVVAPPSDRTTWIDRAFLERTVPEVFRWRAHVCGPEAMMTAMTGYLRELGVPADQIFTEAFTAARSAPAGGTGEAHQVTFAASAHAVAVRGSATILDAADAAGVAIESSCRVGVCGACKVRLLRGRVAMGVDEALTDIDRANDVVLACQAVPQTDVEVGA